MTMWSKNRTIKQVYTLASTPLGIIAVILSSTAFIFWLVIESVNLLINVGLVKVIQVNGNDDFAFTVVFCMLVTLLASMTLALLGFLVYWSLQDFRQEMIKFDEEMQALQD